MDGSDRRLSAHAQEPETAARTHGRQERDAPSSSRAGTDGLRPELPQIRVSRRFDRLGADGARARLGIMGGTFDPIHIGHLRIAEEVREALGLDAVLFVPTGVSVFKRDQRIADAEVRFRQVSEAVAHNPHFDASRIEIDRVGDTFTVDTLRELRRHYPENVELVFIVGSDTAETIGKWRAVDEIAQLACLAVAVGRPGSAGDEELAALIEAAAPFRYDLVNVTALEISSSEIRHRLATGRSVRYLVPEPVERDLCQEGARACEPSVQASEARQRPNGRPWPPSPHSQTPDARQGALASAPSSADGACAPGAEASPPEASASEASAALVDALSAEFFEARKAELATRVGKKRFAHSLGVSEACAELARRYGLDVAKARLAGLLHDWDKGYDDEGARARVRELGMADALDPWVVENMPRVLHGNTAAVALGRAFPQIPADVLQAIDRHTTAAVEMSDLDKVLYIADAIEPSRQFGRIDELREAAKTAPLDELYFQTYEYWTFLLLERRAPLHPDTMRIWNANVLRRQRDKPKRKGKRKGDKSA